MNSNDNDLIIKATQDFLAAWNKGDVQLVTSFFTDDAIRVSGVGASGPHSGERQNLKPHMFGYFKKVENRWLIAEAYPVFPSPTVSTSATK